MVITDKLGFDYSDLHNEKMRLDRKRSCVMQLMELLYDYLIDLENGLKEKGYN